MASYNADINVVVRSSQAERKLDLIEKKLNGLASAAAKIDLGDNAKKEAVELTRILEVLKLKLENLSNIKFDLFGPKGADSASDRLRGIRTESDRIVRTLSKVSAEFETAFSGTGAAGVEKAFGRKQLDAFIEGLGQIRREILGLPGLPAALDFRRLTLEARSLEGALSEIAANLKPGTAVWRQYQEAIEFTQRALTTLDDKAKQATGSLDTLENRRATNTYRVRQARKKLVEDAVEEAAEAEIASRQTIYDLEQDLARNLFSIESKFEDDLVREKIANADRVANAELKANRRANDRELKDFDRRLNLRTKTREKRAKTRAAALSGALVGGGFPLLFGQGAGASVGGALGGGLGALGGQQLGFGLSLIGTVVGQAFDNIVAGAQDLGKALNPLTADIGALATAAGLAGTETEKLLKAVEAQVGATAAQALAAEQLAAIVGDSGVASLKELGEESQRLSNSLTKALTALKAAISPLVAEILRATASNVDRTRLVGSALSQGFLGVEIKPDFQNVPELIKAVEKFNKGLINEKDLQKLATLVALSRELEKQSEANVKAFQALFNASSRTVQIAQINLDLALAQNGVYGEGAAALERQAALQERLARDAKLRREAESDPAKAAQLANNLAESRIKYERSILDIQRKQQQGMLDAARQRLELARDYLSVEEKINQATLERTRETGRLLEQLKRAAIEERNAETGRIVAGSKLISTGSDPIGVKKEEIRLANLLQKREQERLQIENTEARQAGLRSRTELDYIDKKYKSLKEAASLEYVSNWINLQLDLERLKVAEARAEANAKATFTSKRDTLQARLDSPLGGDRYEQEILAIEQRNRRLSETSVLIDKIEAQEKVAGDLRTQGRVKDAERIEEVINKDRKKLDLRQQELTLLEQLEMRELKLGQAIEKILPVATAFADGLTQGLQGIIDGTMSVEEAFAKMLRGMADALMQAAATMIAQYIAIGIAKAFAGMSGGGGGNRGGTAPGKKPFAEGGFVTGPTHALIGEGSQPEYVIPENKMGEAMSRYNAGARGSSVIPGKGGGDSAAGASGGGAVINYNGPTLNFNSEDYVPTSAVAGIIDEATKRGAKAGEARTFATLRNSRSQRSRIGMGR